jgi:hypothetical protein
LAAHFDEIARTSERRSSYCRATPESLPALAVQWFAPARAALVRGRLASLAMVADGAGVATWTATRPGIASA